MENETAIPVEQYAAQHRISIYKAIQMANRGELKSKVEEEGGKKRTYIIVSGDEAPADAAPAKAAEAPQEEMDYKAAYEALQKEMEALKAKAAKGE